MSRLFTFGCSFTNYHWPTWADIVSQDFEHYENWGQIGAGNKFIYFSLVECQQRKNITSDDTVIIMWSSQAREDRFIKDKWHTPGVVYDNYDEYFLENLVDADGYLLDTVTYIQSSVTLLQSIGCKYVFLSMLPMNISTCFNSRNWLDRFIKKLNPDTADKILALYAPALNEVKPSIYETVFNGDWHSRDDNIMQIKNNKKTKDILYQNYVENATDDWPTFEDFFNDNMAHVKVDTIDEIDKQFHFIETRDKIKHLIRPDNHPTPLEHLEYLNLVNVPVSKKATDFAGHWNDLVIKGDAIWSNKKVERL